ncbi:MAG TPA: hypothetical protein VD770_04990, partial [Coxiellaceae bacterium]|nr:hypothetical protein [Coxiellaceae bacterium]
FISLFTGGNEVKKEIERKKELLCYFYCRSFIDLINETNKKWGRGDLSNERRIVHIAGYTAQYCNQVKQMSQSLRLSEHFDFAWESETAVGRMSDASVLKGPAQKLITLLFTDPKTEASRIYQGLIPFSEDEIPTTRAVMLPPVQKENNRAAVQLSAACAQILGVDRQASLEEVEKAFRAKAKKLHTDKLHFSGSEEQQQVQKQAAGAAFGQLMEAIQVARKALDPVLMVEEEKARTLVAIVRAKAGLPRSYSTMPLPELVKLMDNTINKIELAALGRLFKDRFNTTYSDLVARLDIVSTTQARVVSDFKEVCSIAWSLRHSDWDKLDPEEGKEIEQALHDVSFEEYREFSKDIRDQIIDCLVEQGVYKRPSPSMSQPVNNTETDLATPSRTFK